MESGVQISGRPHLTKRCKHFVTASISMQEVVLLWRYIVKWASQTRYTLRCISE